MWSMFVLGVFFRGFGNLSPVVSGMAPDTCLKGSSSSLEGKLHSPLTLICSPYITIMKCQLATSSAAEQMSPPNYCCCRVSVFILSRQAVTALAASHHSLATQLLHIWKKIEGLVLSSKFLSAGSPEQLLNVPRTASPNSALN